VLPKGTVVPAEGPVAFAGDIGYLLERDPATRDAMSALAGHYEISDWDRHSFHSAGPRYHADEDLKGPPED
jgi:glucose-1-phosphate adenylyltransferase